MHGRKRHILVDTLGLLLRALVTPANAHDRDGVSTCWSADRESPCVELVRVDGAYACEFENWVQTQPRLACGRGPQAS